jgi:hypothetical protein
MPLTDGWFGLENGGVGGFAMSCFNRFCTSIFALVILLCVPLHAQTQSQSSGSNALPPPVDRSGSTEAKKKITAAEAELKRAQQALADVVAKLRSDFEGGQDWQTAATAQKQAQADYEAARKPVVEAVKKKPAYQSAEREKADAEKELNELRAKNTIGEPILKAVNKQSDAANLMLKLENEALSADPKVAEARKKLADANTALAALKKQFDGSLAADTNWQEAKKGVDTAQEQVVGGQKELKEALAREKDADKARQEQIRQTRKGY